MKQFWNSRVFFILRFLAFNLLILSSYCFSEGSTGPRQSCKRKMSSNYFFILHVKIWSFSHYKKYFQNVNVLYCPRIGICVFLHNSLMSHHQITKDYLRRTSPWEPGDRKVPGHDIILGAWKLILAFVLTNNVFLIKV